MDIAIILLLLLLIYIVRNEAGEREMKERFICDQLREIIKEQKAAKYPVIPCGEEATTTVVVSQATQR